MDGRRLILALALTGAAAGISGCGVEEPDGAGPATQVESVTSALSVSPALPANTRFFVPPPDQGGVQQVASLIKSWQLLDAARLTAMGLTPQAVWFTSGTPSNVKKAVKKTMDAAALQGSVPVLVSYNIPFRDCAQYSAGGALDATAYQAWIDGFAAGIGKGKAVVVLEPDSLGLIPGTDCPIYVTDSSGNQVPAPGADQATRLSLLNYAVDKLAAKAPKALVYLDATHSGWLNVGDASTRLSLAGVARAQGFFLNISNYQLSPNLVYYGTWISECLAYGTLVNAGDFGSCPNQYWNGGPPDWNGTALDPYSVWSETSPNLAQNTSEITLRYTGMLGATVPTTHFIIDTSRNGNGPLDGNQYIAAPYGQSVDTAKKLTQDNWCNPPGAGNGLRPTANTGSALLDAYLWVKIPGESDGQCDSAGGARVWDYSAYNPWGVPAASQDQFDPEWGMVDPAAGLWFPQQALQLAQLANPPLL
jgi:endoglucanase